MRKQLRKFSLVTVPLFLAACGGDTIELAEYQHRQCNRVALTDSVTGEKVIGIEDIAVDWVTQKIFFSAHDRRTLEKAVRKRAKILPQGGVYRLGFQEVFESQGKNISVTPMIAPTDVTGGLHPHGIAYDATHEEILFINRTYQRDGDKWRMTPKIQRVGANGELVIAAAQQTHCAANNLVVSSEELYTTFDRGFCDWRAGFETVFGLKRSGLIGRDGEVTFKSARFANGVVETQTSTVLVGATRENAIHVFSMNASFRQAKIKLPGGPDNLTLAQDGSVIAALHPAKLKLALNRKLGVGSSPSRIVKIDPDSQTVTLLFDDPKGKLFSAATVGIETGQGLILGSVTDEGLLVCKEDV